jgi:uncharacterized protein YkwD
MPDTANRARTLVRALMSLLAVTAITAGPASAADVARCPRALDVPSSANVHADDDVITCLINAERTSRGLRPLRRDRDLAQAARHHASDMARRNYFSHVTPGGADLGDRIRAAGYGRGRGWRAGEALGWGTGTRATPAALIDEWIASPPHRHVLLDRGFRELGVGVVTGAPRRTSGLAGATYAVDVGVVH